MNPKKVFVDAGETVFPGQALAIIDSTKMLGLGLYQISRNDSMSQTVKEERRKVREDIARTKAAGEWEI